MKKSNLLFSSKSITHIWLENPQLFQRIFKCILVFVINFIMFDDILAKKYIINAINLAK